MSSLARIFRGRGYHPSLMETALPIDMDPKDLLKAQQAGREIVLVDCREPWEYEIAHLPGSMLIPLGQLYTRAGEVPQTGDVVVYCHHGIRSRQGAAILRHLGIAHARSLAGGIDEWSQVIDPTVPRY